MRMVGQASGRAFTEAMRRQFTKEKDIHAFLEYQFKANGCDGLAFIPVIAGGQVRLFLPVFRLLLLRANDYLQNALSIHYVRNDDVLRYGGNLAKLTECDAYYLFVRNGNMVLVDGGGVRTPCILYVTRLLIY